MDPQCGGLFDRSHEEEYPIPDYPLWVYCEKDGRRYWATRDGEKGFGVAAFPKIDVGPPIFDPPLRTERPRATIVEITSKGWQWSAPETEMDFETVEEAYAKALEWVHDFPTVITLERL